MAAKAATESEVTREVTGKCCSTCCWCMRVCLASCWDFCTCKVGYGDESSLDADTEKLSEDCKMEGSENVRETADSEADSDDGPHTDEPRNSPPPLLEAAKPIIESTTQIVQVVVEQLSVPEPIPVDDTPATLEHQTSQS